MVLAGLLAGAPEAAADAAQGAPSADVAKSGPAASSVGGQWKAEWAADGRSVVYTWAGRHAVAFRLVEPREPGAKPAFVSTTEVTAGLFIDVANAAGRCDELKALLPPCEGLCDPRRGPRVWHWSRDGQTLRLARAWLVPRPGYCPYPSEARPDRPSQSHPMQQVSPAAAAYFARLLGCRLAASAEWRAACADAGAGEAAGWNLRDRAWQRQQAHVRGAFASGTVGEWGDAGIFLPPGAQAKQGENALGMAGRDDGVLWFAPMGSGGGFEHLVGNVAEFVLDCPERFDETFREPRSISAADVIEFLRENAGAVGVIGGSALSPPELWDGKERPFGRAWPIGVGQLRAGAADVGFRLAFTAPGRPGAGTR